MTAPTETRRRRPTIRRRRRAPRIVDAALAGAAAGLAGGAAVLAVRLLAERGVLALRGTADDDWRDIAASVADRLGLDLSRRQRAVAGATAHLVYSALLGALYGVGARGVALPGPARGMLGEVLTYGARLPAQAVGPLLGPRRKLRRKLRGLASGRRAGLLAVSSDDVYSMATAAAFRALG